MFYSASVYLLFLSASVNCGVLLWTNKQFRLPALKVMTDDDFNNLIAYLDQPKVVMLKGDPNKHIDTLKKIISDKYTAYIPTEDLSLEENVIDLSYESLANLSRVSNDKNILYVIVNEENKKIKRAIENDDDNTDDEKTDDTNELPTGPVWYNADGKAMIYSSRPLLLRMNATNLVLGKAYIANIDSRGSYTRLNVAVTYEGRKIWLRFKFIWTVSGYWSLKSVEIEDDNDAYTLFAAMDLTASRRFSYHCTGEIIFTHSKNDIDLILYDIQAQPDSLNSIFGSAYDCVSFTTVPIWSGIFVSLILVIGLAFGLGAMDSIKTMDRFDNSKTKPLPIAIGD